MNRMIGCHGNYEFYIAHIMFFSHFCGSNKQYGINEKLSWDERFVKLDSGVNPLPRHEDIMDLCNFGLNLTVFPCSDLEKIRSRSKTPYQFSIMSKCYIHADFR